MHTPFRSWFLSTAVILSAQVLHGHDPGLSSAVVRVTDEGFEARLTFSPTDVEVLVPLDTDRDGLVSRAEFETARTRITNALMDSFEIGVDDRAVPITTADVSLRIEEDNVQARLLFDTADGRRLTVRSAWLKQLPFGHRQYLAIVDRDGHELERRLLDAENPSATVPVGSDTTRSAEAEFGSFFSLGVEHIVTGYDHLLFLLLC